MGQEVSVTSERVSSEGKSTYRRGRRGDRRRGGAVHVLKGWVTLYYGDEWECPGTDYTRGLQLTLKLTPLASNDFNPQPKPQPTLCELLLGCEQKHVRRRGIAAAEEFTTSQLKPFISRLSLSMRS